MSEKILVWVKECGGDEWNNRGYMEYLKGRIVRVKRSLYYDDYKVTSSNVIFIDRNHWLLKSDDFIVITPEVRKLLIDVFKKDRSLFVLKDKKKE